MTPPPLAVSRRQVLVMVFVGGCAGGLARYGATTLWTTPAGAFPWSTWTVNVSGSFLLGLLLQLCTEVLTGAPRLRPLLASGFCGAFTTFSAVTASGDLLLAQHRPAVALAYVGSSFLAALGAVALGLLAGRQLSALAPPRAGAR